jgi:hypothetical protein
MSGENPRGPVQTEATHQNLLSHLKKIGLKHEEVKGHYGSPERAVLIHNPTEDQMVDLGKKFGQESVIHSTGGKHKLVYTHGPDVGKVHTADTHEFFQHPPEDFYTELPGHGHFRINFDFSKPPELPKMAKSTADGGQVEPEVDFWDHDEEEAEHVPAEMEALWQSILEG